jgi:Predicted nucleic acid-binding protein, contains PIN domain
MKVLVDACIWSIVLRRRKTIDIEVINNISNLIDNKNIVLVGPVRQEILSGIKEAKQFESLKNHLRAFEDYPVTVEDYEMASSFYNSCRSKGIQGSNTDFLICAIALNNNFQIYTNDKDFEKISNVIPLSLFQ